MSFNLGRANLILSANVAPTPNRPITLLRYTFNMRIPKRASIVNGTNTTLGIPLGVSASVFSVSLPLEVTAIFCAIIVASMRLHTVYRGN